MNEIQTAEFAIRCSVAVVILLLGAACCEIYRVLLKSQEEAERLRRLNSKNYMHRVQMERAITNYKASLKDPSFYELLNAGKASKEDHD